MQRDDVVTLADRVSVKGLGYLTLLILLHKTTVPELHLITREDRHTIGDLLNGLEMRGLAIRVQAGRWFEWFPSQKGFSLIGSDGGGIPTTIASTTTAAISSPDENQKAVVEAPHRGVIPATKAPTLCAKTVAALRACGIGANLHAELCALKWVTVAYVSGHDAYRRSRGESVGLLITRLRAGDPVPKPVPKRPKQEKDVAKDWQEFLASNGRRSSRREGKN